jgi:nucleoid-associated protein YgaU
MDFSTILRSLFLFAVGVLLCSCTKPQQLTHPPLIRMEAAEYMVSMARDKQAQVFAPSEYQAAQSALADAHSAMGQNDYNKAAESLNFALTHARRAVKLADEGQARQAKEEAERIRQEEQARQAEQLKLKKLETPPQKPEVPPPPKLVPKQPQKVEPVTSYSVGEGETLWTISAEPQVYGDGLLWPLLYQANRDQIKDPRQIFPGQVLSIRRDMSDKDLEDARQRARESDIFPVSDSGVQTQ